MVLLQQLLQNHHDWLQHEELHTQTLYVRDALDAKDHSGNTGYEGGVCLLGRVKDLRAELVFEKYVEAEETQTIFYHRSGHRCSVVSLFLSTLNVLADLLEVDLQLNHRDGC